MLTYLIYIWSNIYLLAASWKFVFLSSLLNFLYERLRVFLSFSFGQWVSQATAELFLFLSWHIPFIIPLYFLNSDTSNWQIYDKLLAEYFCAKHLSIAIADIYLRWIIYSRSSIHTIDHVLNYSVLSCAIFRTINAINEKSERFIRDLTTSRLRRLMRALDDSMANKDINKALFSPRKEALAGSPGATQSAARSRVKDAGSLDDVTDDGGPAMGCSRWWCYLETLMLTRIYALSVRQSWALNKNSWPHRVDTDALEQKSGGWCGLI